MAAHIPPAPLHFLRYPSGTYGISFTLSTQKLEDDPPNGWGISSTSDVYARIGEYLIGMGLTEQVQDCEPLGIIPTCLDHIEMFRAHEPIIIAVVDPQALLGGDAA